ncbi:MAG: dTDP-4-dehydrorhamnose 3,5-epimerase family protein [Deltaproteobacteria bacterium]|nr:dTDP-4-dehydrorhamnose 3,5-epimerase family protein [Deltaproteobacteria bacterium]MCB9487542.1 dTDP-4-dehydrorhamnose 3,5-epimerase family protein [Deltaproteobacteria bacterium]
MIQGVVVKPLKIIPDERGRLMEILRCDDDIYEKFGQVYMTTAYPGVTKAWHYHKLQDDHFAVVKGMMKLVLFDSRDPSLGFGYEGEVSPTAGKVNEFFLGDSNPILVKIPKMVMHGFKGIGTEETIVINTVTMPYNYKEPDELRWPPHDGSIPYDWARHDG